MSSPAAGTNEPAPPVVEPPAQPAIGRRLPSQALAAGWAIAIIALGSAMLSSKLGLLSPNAQHVIDLAWPAGLMLSGLGMILAGDRLWKPRTAGFALERGEAEQADLVAAAETADLRIAAIDEGAELAAGELPLPKGPKVEIDGHRTTLRLEPLVPALFGSRWALALAKGMPWRLNLRSTTGNLDLDLRDLAVTMVGVRSTFGDVDLTLPAAGGADLDISLVFGNLAVHVPDGLGVKVKVAKGALAGVDHDERRFIRMAPNEIGTPLYAVSAQRCTLTVWLGAGDLHLQ